MKKLCMWILLLSALAAGAQGIDSAQTGLTRRYVETLRGGIAMDGWAADSSREEVVGWFWLAIPKGAKLRKVFLASSLKTAVPTTTAQTFSVAEDVQVSVAGYTIAFSQRAWSELSYRAVSYWIEEAGLEEAVVETVKKQMAEDGYSGTVRISVVENGDEGVAGVCQDFAVMGHNLVVVWEHEEAPFSTVSLSEGIRWAQVQSPVGKAPGLQDAAAFTLAHIPSPVCTEAAGTQQPHILSVSVLEGMDDEVPGTAAVLSSLEVEGKKEVLVFWVGGGGGGSCGALKTGSLGGGFNDDGLLCPQSPREDFFPQEIQTYNGSALLNLGVAELDWASEVAVHFRRMEGLSALTLVAEQRPACGENRYCRVEGGGGECVDVHIAVEEVVPLGGQVVFRGRADFEGGIYVFVGEQLICETSTAAAGFWECIVEEEALAPGEHRAYAVEHLGHQVFQSPEFVFCLGGGCGTEVHVEEQVARAAGFSGGGSGCGSPARGNVAFLVGGYGLFWGLRRTRRRG
ncbi:MAG: hypothetical protein FWC18_04885 [Cystobacterineae bacterium]|nr:hypothetical protein [Cystobacterineae bacterium]MCL2259139.1 hypothetical protein [Cystobacterineae bacterium]